MWDKESSEDYNKVCILALEACMKVGLFMLCGYVGRWMECYPIVILNHKFCLHGIC